MITHSLIFLIGLQLFSATTAQSPNFRGYSTVDRFSCEDTRALERIILTAQCGLIISPCYPDNYPEEVGNGHKIWDVDANGAGNPPVVAYRFTINDFDTDEVGGNLDFSLTLTFDPNTNINSIFSRQRLLSFSGNAGEDPGLRVRVGRRTSQHLLNGEFLDINETRLYLNFYASREIPQRGFNITYCADFDRCDPSYSPPVCDPDGSSQCVRNGFNNYSCVCATGFTGERCDIDINECLDDICAENANCQNTEGSFQCECDEGYTGNGFVNCSDLDECANGLSSCARNVATCVNTDGSYLCACNDGYSGDGRTCRNINECFANPCDVNADCTDLQGSFACTCRNGYTGDGIFCTDIDECAIRTGFCDEASRAMCNNTEGSFSCSCLSGFTGSGRTCININECDSATNDCDSNAMCIDTEGSFNCICRLGYSGNGRSCVDIDECAENLDDCADDVAATCMNTDGSFTCMCNEGFTGDGRVCNNINECLTSNPCDVNARCTDTRGSVTCTCDSGFTGNGTNCEDIDECEQDTTNNCAPRNTSTCFNLDGSFECQCNPGYSGDGRTCANVNECMLNPCDSNAECEDTSGSYICSCMNGYQGDGEFCADIDECMEETNNCAGNNTSVCRNTNGSFVCSCRNGYTGNGIVCTNLNECEGNPCDSNASCVDFGGSFSCTCNTGYQGNGFECTDINECRERTHDCPNRVSFCFNTEGSFTCSCTRGFAGDGRNCTNINECLSNPCDINAVCEDVRGSFDCRCNEGYSGNGLTCLNINECEMDPCDENALCEDSFGSFMCTCEDGYRGSGFECSDINECTDGPSPCATDNSSTCVNTVGSFMCSCNEGYSGDGRTCRDIDECSMNICDENARCTNNIGSFTCMCRNGFSGNGRFCTNIDECTTLRPCHADAVCTDSAGSFSCSCMNGFTGDGITNCTDINECDLANCDENANCINDAGSFSCVCRSGYSGNGLVCLDIDECEANEDTCNRDTLQERCVNTPGSFECSCNTPSYRGTPPDCMGFFCPGEVHLPAQTRASECNTPGIIEWPNFYDGNQTYQRSQIVSWFVNLTNIPNTAAIRFRFLELSVESPQDYIIFSEQNTFLAQPRLAVISGSLNEVFNYKCRANSTNPVGYDDATKTYLVIGTEIYVHFYSDRQNVSTGFQIEYEPVQDADDCPSANPCFNGGVCVDGIFTYSCQGCASGYAGQNCSEDIDECSEGVDDCDSDADCINSNGGYTCVCRDTYSGNGTFCSPLILLSNLQVSSVNNATISFLVVNFVVSEPWGRNASFVLNYRIRLSYRRVNRGISVDSGNLDNLLPIHVPVPPASIVSVSVSSGEIGDLFSEASYEEDRTGPILFVSNSIIPLPPRSLRVVSSDELFVNISWRRQDDPSRGPIAAFELAYRRNESECELYEALGPQIDCGNETLIRFVPDENFYLIFDLQRYRNYNIRLRALTTGGHSEWTEYVTAFTGNVCPPQSSATQTMTSPCTSRFASLSSSNFPSPYMGFERSYWLIDFRGQGALRIIFDYFDIEMNQDYVEIGEGRFPMGRLRTNESTVTSYTGNLTGQVSDLIFVEDNVNNGMVFVRFTSDLFTFTQSRGFQIRYETNASQCEPNPCQNLSPCTATDFDFQCRCRFGLWTGKACNAPLINIQALCNSSTSDSVVVSWSVTSQWQHEIAAIPELLISYKGQTVRQPTGTTSYTVTGLQPNRLVNITIAVNPIHPNAPVFQSTATCMTSEGLPNPPHINGTALSSTAIEVIWEPSQPSNGEILAYNVTYEQSDAAVYNESSVVRNELVTETTFSVDGLRAHRNYTFFVSVINSIGTGPSNYTLVTTLPIAPAGPVQNVVATPQARSVMLDIAPPSLVTGPFTYDLVLTSANGTLPSFTGIPSSYNARNLIPFTFYNATIYPRSAGIQGRFPFVFNFTTLEDIPGPVVNLLPNQVTSDSLLLSWDPPIELNGVITGYRVEWLISRRNRSSPFLPSNSTTFFVTGLRPFNEYRFYVFAYTSAGRGMEPGYLLTRTASDVPSAVRNFLVTVNPNNSFTITFDQPAILNGELLDYDIQITQNQTECELFNDPVDNCVSLQHTILHCERASLTTIILPSYRYFTITARARTCAGSGPPLSATVQTFPTDSEDMVENIRFISTDPTEVSVEFYAPIPITGPTNYVVTATSRLGNVSTQTLEGSVSLRHSVNFTGLNPNVSYFVFIARNTSSGLVNASQPVLLSRAPSLRRGAAVLPYTGDPDLEGASRTHAFLVENPCNRKGEIFSEEEGPVESIDLVVKDIRSEADQDIDVWSNAITQSPVPPFLTGTIDCTESSRKRRQVNSDGDGYIVGFDTSCSQSDNGVCNGPVTSGRTYQVAYRANNPGGSSPLTPFGGNTFVPRTPGERPTSLQAGEVAAIVATVTLVLLLLLFLVVYFVNRRWQSQGSYAASEKEDKAKNDNKNGVQSSEPQASYTTTNETHEEATEESADDIMKTGKETAV